MNKTFSVGLYILLSLNVCLLLLATFSGEMSVPIWLMPLGRMHPLILHLPIGFFVLSLILFFYRREIAREVYLKIEKLIWFFISFSSVASALFGLVLNAEGSYGGQNLFWHKWLGVVFSLFALVAYLNLKKVEKSAFLQKIILFGGLALITFTGHFGANLTHGEGFVSEPLYATKEPEVTLDSKLYEVAIQPILEAKCYSCHNDKKQKGDLNMANVALLMKGGKNGPIWQPGNALESHMIQMTQLPLDDKKHMPPKGKPQLTAEEIGLISAWINSGADMEKTIAEYADSSSLKKNILALVQKEEENSYTFSALPDGDIEELNTPFCSVFPLADGSPALVAEFYVSRKFDPKTLENLRTASEQLVSLSLDKMPVTDEQLLAITDLKHLENLNLNGTKITSKGLKALYGLKNLKELSLALTKMDAKAVRELLGQLPKLQRVYFWETGLSDKDVASIRNDFPKLMVDEGYQPDPNEKLQLNPPTLENKNFVFKDVVELRLSHVLSGVKIRYTLDGSEPDTLNSQIYSKPIRLDTSFVVKALAEKEGWWASNAVSGSFLASGFKPDTVWLASMPNPKYTGSGPAGLTDAKLGDLNSFTGPRWLGFQNAPCIIFMHFNNNPSIERISLSYLTSPGSHIFPPETVEVYGKGKNGQWKEVQRLKPKVNTEDTGSQRQRIDLKMGGTAYPEYKIVVKPLLHLPAWHPEKGKPGWFFIDELLVN